METLTAAANGLVLVVEREAAGWKTTVRSASNPLCSYRSQQCYTSIEDAQAAAVRISLLVWGERIECAQVTWRIPNSRETGQGPEALAAGAGR
ncbi:MAG TPA: hypothetical protein VFA04_23125 [Bryobacteraceae bacterium]|nr:hypothetical protein [Bryobacteraceae bacterium]